jgi:hypothetical protein
MSDPEPEEPEVAWLRAEITKTREYAQKIAALRPINAMRSYEMRDLTIACEAHLTLLGDHGGEHMCSAGGNTWDWWIGDCRVMTTLASAYRYRNGYEQHWGARVA